MSYFTYILTNKNNSVLYTGVTNDIERRLYEHKNDIFEGFSKKYQTHKLIYLEIFNSPEEAISNEKRIKGWTRKRKIGLINIHNPTWRDLSDSL